MKTFDKNEFFRQATIRICGTLDIEKSLNSCLKYLNTYMSVTGMYVLLFESQTGIMRVVAFASNDENEERFKDFLIPKDIQKPFESEWSAQQKTIIITSDEEDSLAQRLSKFTNMENRPLLVLPLKLEGRRLGALTAYTDGTYQYSSYQADLFSMLNEPFSIAMSNALKHKEVINLMKMLEDDNQFLHQELFRISGDEIIGAESGLKNVMEMVRQVSPLKSPVLLLGETGVGKEVIANAIHYSSSRKDGPFLKVNCGAIPESLIDSELFGYESGAFTGAVRQKRGYFERAHKGTIFLDEIGDLPLQVQVRLLRVIQYGRIERVGGVESVDIDIRIISATHSNLEEMVRLNRFREDLWYRVNVFPIMVPPLRQRKEDLPALIHYLFDRKSREMKLLNRPEITSETIDRLKDYHFPGNVRELENMVERVLIQNQRRNDRISLAFDQSYPSGQSNETYYMSAPKNPLLTLNEVDSDHIRQVLNQTSGRIAGKGGAAEILGIHPNTLRGKMKKLGIKFKNS